MTGRELVKEAINHRKTMRVPRGELVVPRELILRAANIVGEGPEDLFPLQKEFFYRYGLDLAVVTSEPPLPLATGFREQDKEVYLDCLGRCFIDYGGAPYYFRPSLEVAEAAQNLTLPSPDEYGLKELANWVQQTDLFVFGLVGGGFYEASTLLGFEKFLVATKNNTEKVACLIEKLVDHHTKLALAMIKKGAHGIIIGDDFAFRGGTYVAPHVLRFLLFPYLEKAVATLHQEGVPVFLHSDGNLTAVLDDLAAIGFDGLHSLDGMDLAAVKRSHGSSLCLMGNLDVGLLEGEAGDGELEAALGALLEAGTAAGTADGGFIFSTSSGLTGSVDLARLEKMYKILDNWGIMSQ